MLSIRAHRLHGADVAGTFAVLEGEAVQGGGSICPEVDGANFVTQHVHLYRTCPHGDADTSTHARCVHSVGVLTDAAWVVELEGEFFELDHAAVAAWDAVGVANVDFDIGQEPILVHGGDDIDLLVVVQDLKSTEVRSAIFQSREGRGAALLCWAIHSFLAALAHRIVFWKNVFFLTTEGEEGENREGEDKPCFHDFF